MKNLIQIIAVFLIFMLMIVFSAISASAATPAMTAAAPEHRSSELPPDIFDDCDGGPSCPGRIFTDMPAAGHWSHAAIDWALTHHITTGTTETTFSPNQGCTRAQAVMFLWIAKGSPEPVSETCAFEDVSATAYYYKAVLWAVENQITTGTAETTFSPKQTCTRAQIVTFLWRAMGSPAPADPSAELPFLDVSDGAYYRDAVRWAIESKITSGTSATSFSPKNTCTRAQIVTFLYKAIHG